jgi:hypothetical protein
MGASGVGRSVVAVSGALAIVVIAGCTGEPRHGRVTPSVPAAATAGTAGGGAAQPLAGRVNEYWRRRQGKDLAGAYAFYCPAYRARVSQPEFLQMTRLVRFDLSDIKIAAVVEEGDHANVRVTYKFPAPNITPGLLEGETTEAWRRDSGGQWCKQDEPLTLPFPQTAPPGRP